MVNNSGKLNLNLASHIIICPFFEMQEAQLLLISKHRIIMKKVIALSCNDVKPFAYNYRTSAV